MLNELVRSQLASRHGIDNTPSREEIDNLVFLTRTVLQPIRDYFGLPVTVSSGFRCDELNAMVGGSKRSQHRLGEAADIEIYGIPNATLAAFIRDNLVFDQLILEYHKTGEPNSGWVHVSKKRQGDNRNVVLHTPDGKRFAYGIPNA